jgi:ADP-ribose pyrophosphatase YjhB (NUDIX family)
MARDYDNAAGKEFWGDVGAGVLPYCPLTKRFLINLRSQEVNEPGTWGVWGGKMDWGETEPVETAERELREETQFKGKIDLKLLCVFKTEGFQ